MDHGALGEAQAILELVRPFARGTSILRPLLIELDGARRLAVGELEGLDAALERGVALARGGDVSVQARLEMLRRELIERREAIWGDTTDDAVAPPSPWEPQEEWSLRRAFRAARSELATGDPTDALEATKRVRERAAHARLPVLEADALLLVADGLFAALSIDELADLTQTLGAHADALGSPRLRHHAAFYEGHGDPAVLERLASEDHVAPRAARRARVLLGLPAASDAIDEQVLAAARTSWTDQRLETSGATETYEPAWGLDTIRSSVWLPDGRTIALAKKPLLFRVLTTLADQGGEASKETLINHAWDDPEYHPIRHDPKLHVSIRALRKAIEDDPSQPERLLTTEGGYALGGVVRRVLANER